MSDEQLYALALSLVPDRDVAGDLFMDAANEKDLRRRAAAWLERRGLPVPAQDPPLPELTEADRTFAAHLARRGRRRRQARRLVTVVAAAVLVAAVGLLALPWLKPAATRTALPGVAQVPELAADPTYREQPVTATTGKDGLDLVVYRTQTTFGSTTIWWAVEGRGAGRLAGVIAPSLEQNGRPADVVSDERASSRSDRVVGRTKFRLSVGEQASVGFSLARLPDAGVAWQVALLLAPGPDPDGRWVIVNRRVSSSDALKHVTIHSIILAPDYTLVYYTAEGIELPMAQLLELWAPYQRLGQITTLEAGRGDGIRMAIYEPVPDWASSLEIRFPRLTRREWTMASYKLPAPEVVRDWVRGERSVHAQLEFPPEYIVEHPWVRVTDKLGQEYEFQVQVVKKSNGAVVEITRASGLPPDNQLDQLLVDGLGRDLDLPSIQLPLPGDDQ